MAAQIPDESQRRGQLVLRTLPILLIPVVVGVVFALLIRFVLGVGPVQNEPRHAKIFCRC